MANKAAKAQAQRNTATLNRTHLISLGIYIFFLIYRTLISKRSLPLFILISTPALAIELWFERIARPTYITDTTGTKELRRPGEDLKAKGLTEWMWDVVYWTWGNVLLVALAGDWAYWLYLVVPAYSAYLAFTTYTGVRRELSGMRGAAGGQIGANGEGSESGGQSRRSLKMEKRGGQRVQYR